MFLQEEFGYSDCLIATTATVEEIVTWWQEGGFHPFGEEAGHFTRRLPGEQVGPRMLIAWRPPANPCPMVGDGFSLVESIQGELCPQTSVCQYGSGDVPHVFIHAHMGADDLLIVGEREYPHPHEREWERLIWGWAE